MKKIFGVIMLMCLVGCASVPVSPTNVVLTHDYEDVRNCKQVDTVSFNCNDDACIKQTALAMNKDINTVYIECDKLRNVKTSIGNVLNRTGTITLNTTITAFNTAVITPLNIAWVSLLIFDSMEKPARVTSYTTVKEKGDKIKIDTQYYYYAGKPATPLPTKADGTLPVIPYIKWQKAKDAEPLCSNYNTGVGYNCSK